LVSFALLLAGCATVGPDFVQPASPAITNWQAADSKTMPPDAAEQIRWWESFGETDGFGSGAVFQR
jgi:starvation-inducible outer membrane lipoprotein